MIMKLKKMNKGFTLIEVCIASAILAIALSPFVNNFIQASKMNLRSRQDLNATNLAQDIFEGMAVYNAADLKDILNNNTGVADSVEADGTVVPAPHNLIDAIMPVGTTYDATINSGFVTSAVDKQYDYIIKNVKTAESPLNEYDVRVRLDGTDAEVGKYAARDYADITSTDTYFDATFVMPATEIDTAIGQVKDSTKSASEAEYKGKLKRTIAITIDNKVAGDPNSGRIVTVDRTYTVASSSDYATLGNKVETITSGDVFKSDSKILRSVYLYYEGMENATKNNDIETIYINNKTGEKVIVYLIRTIKSETAYSDATKTYNYNYGCDVNIDSLDPEVEIPGDPTGAKRRFPTTLIVSNLRFNLCEEPEKNFRVYKEGTTEYCKNVVATQAEVDAEPDKDLKYAGDSVYDASRCTYKYNELGSSGFDYINPMPEARYQEVVSDGYQINEDKGLVYKVTVDIYKAGTSEKVAFYTGGVID